MVDHRDEPCVDCLLAGCGEVVEGIDRVYVDAGSLRSGLVADNAEDGGGDHQSVSGVAVAGQNALCQIALICVPGLVVDRVQILAVAKAGPAVRLPDVGQLVGRHTGLEGGLIIVCIVGSQNDLDAGFFLELCDQRGQQLIAVAGGSGRHLDLLAREAVFFRRLFRFRRGIGRGLIRGFCLFAVVCCRSSRAGSQCEDHRKTKKECN